MADTSIPSSGPAVGQEQITSLDASASLAAIPSGAARAVIKPRVAGVYVRLTGGAATSADMLVDAGVPVTITSKLSDVRVLKAAANAVLDVWYFG